jgi:hypothetical protein
LQLTKAAKAESKEKSRQAKIAAALKQSAPKQETSNSSDSLSGFQLFTSPIQPGGSYGLSLNWMSILRYAAPKLAAKLDKGRSLIELWVECQMVDDPEIHALNEDPRPMKDYRSTLSRLKAEKRVYYRALVLEPHLP